MKLDVNGRHVETDIQGFLQQIDEWDEDVAKELAEKDGIQLYNDHWELIYYFREYHEENMVNPTMHTLIRHLGGKSKHFHDQKAYEKHIYGLVPKDPVH